MNKFHSELNTPRNGNNGIVRPSNDSFTNVTIYGHKPYSEFSLAAMA